MNLTTTSHPVSPVPPGPTERDLFRSKVLQTLAQYIDVNYGGEVASMNPSDPFKPGKITEPLEYFTKQKALALLNHPRMSELLGAIIVDDGQKVKETLRDINRFTQYSAKLDPRSEAWAVGLSAIEVTLLNCVKDKTAKDLASSPSIAAILRYHREGRNRFRAGLGPMLKTRLGIALPDKKS